MASLTGIFAPGSPPLVESLRTLEVDPHQNVGPGGVLRASFTFSNLGGAPATGVRVRFAHPQGVAHVAEADEIDGRPLEDEGHLTDAGGAAAGTLNPGEQRRITCTFRVNDTVEDGTILVFQAALLTDQTPLTGTNVERVRVRSAPALENTATRATIAANEPVRPGDTLTIRASVHNAGSSSARDVVAILPVPDYASYVPRSARIDGRLVNGDREPFDYGSGTVVAETLAPGQTISIEYQAAVDSPLIDGARIRLAGTVASAETPEFGISSPEIVVTSPSDFEGDETTFNVLTDDIVTPGVRVPMVLRATNVGTGIAQGVGITFRLPAGLVYAPGSAQVDGQPVSDDSIAHLSFSLGTLAAGRVVEAAITATVVVPQQLEPSMVVESQLRWKGGSRSFARRLTMRVASRFTRARNYVEADRGVTQAADDVTFIAHVYNDGTAPEHNVSLRAIPGPYLDDVRVAELGGESIPYDRPVDLGVVEPHGERTFAIVARVADRVPDRSNVTLGASLEHDSGTTDLGTATVVVRSRPVIARESLAWEIASHEPLRPGATADLVIRFSNSGSDVLRDARLAWKLPPELHIERAVDARRERDGLHFGDVPAQSTHEARITVRLLRAIERGSALAIDATLLGRGISPLQFPTLDIATKAEPQFSAAQLVASPPEQVNAGDRILYELRLRNDGDGPAARLTVRVVPTNLAVYIPSTTSINAMAVPDDAGLSQLWADRGLILADVNPGVDLRVRFEMAVMAPLAAGTAIDTRAVLEWDGTSHAVASTVRVQAQPSLGETSEGSAFSIARLFPSAGSLDVMPVEPPQQAVAPAPAAIEPPEEPAFEPTPDEAAPPLPPQIAALIAEHAERLETAGGAEPDSEALSTDGLAGEVPEAPQIAATEAPQSVAPETPETLAREAQETVASETPQATAPEASDHEERLSEAGVAGEAVISSPPALRAVAQPPPVLEPVLVADFLPERLDNTIKLIERSDGGGLIQHLFAARMLLPETAIGASAHLHGSFSNAGHALRSPLERFFVRLRMPRLTIGGKDLEDRESRAALRALLDDLSQAPAALPSRPPEGVVRLRGTYRGSALRDAATELEQAPLGSVAPWIVNVMLLGDTIEWEGGGSTALGDYKHELQSVFAVLAQLPIDEFHRVLGSSVNRSLDEHLNAVLEALRGAVHAPTE